MMSYLHTKLHDNWISSFRGIAMTRFWDGWTDGRTDGRSDCTPRPAFAFGDAGKNKNQQLYRKAASLSFNTIAINKKYIDREEENTYSL